jgi:putative ATP-binding cassette transporter
MHNWLNSLPLTKLLRRGSDRFNLKMAGLVAFAGLSSAGLMAIINAGAENASNAEENSRMMLLFLVTVFLWAYAQRFVVNTSIKEVEALLSGIRVAIADLIRRADLETLEHIGASEIYTIVAGRTQQISQAASTLIMALQSAAMVFFSVAYLAMVSKVAFFITIGLSAVAVMLHTKRVKVLTAEFGEAQRAENEFLGLLTHLLSGFKETRMSRKRSADLFQHLRSVSVDVQRVKTTAGREFSSHMILSQMMFYALLGGIVFLLPRLGGDYSGQVLKLTAAILFIIGPMAAIVAALPVYSTANVAAQSIFDLEATLASAVGSEEGGRPEAAPDATFNRIVLNKAVFQYAAHGGGTVFRLGPVDLEIRSGEILFLVGGNGSGKSTLLKVLTGLYGAQSGALTMDDTLITPKTLAWYRSHFTAIFSDYHLFDRLYGLEDVDPERVKEKLVLMKIADKTSYENGRFSTLDLSHGQRKRLALAVALLEERPILVLDEWAADQDPPFRHYFYEELLPALRKQGRTIVAVTHDDKYFGVADRVVKLDYGQQVL